MSSKKSPYSTRSSTGSYMVHPPTLISKKRLFATVAGGLGGRAAEEVIFGESEVTTGAAGHRFSQTAGHYIGMFEIGPWSLMDSLAQSGDAIMRMMARNLMSKKLAEDIDVAVKRISDSAYEIALSHIRNNWAMSRLKLYMLCDFSFYAILIYRKKKSNREAIDKIVEVLIGKETMTGG